MPKITLQPIQSGYESNAQTNANLDLIEQQLNEQVLYRSNPVGEPNQMLNSLDMNGNPILNVGTSNQANALLTRQDLEDLTDTVTTSPVLEAIANRQVFTSSGSDITVDATYAYGYVRFEASTPASLIVPVSSQFLDGTEIHVRQAGTGIVTIAEATGVTINPPFGGTLVLAGQGATITIKYVGSNEWDLMGQVFSA